MIEFLIPHGQIPCKHPQLDCWDLDCLINRAGSPGGAGAGVGPSLMTSPSLLLMRVWEPDMMIWYDDNQLTFYQPETIFDEQDKRLIPEYQWNADLPHCRQSRNLSQSQAISETGGRRGGWSEGTRKVELETGDWLYFIWPCYPLDD